MLVLLFALAFALLGAPIFAVMAGATELAWLTHLDADLHHLRFLAPDVLDERFAGSPILITVPVFTFVGYVMAESNAPTRIVRAADAFFGWLPGGLAIVCLIASAFFATLTGGSGVTIVAVGGLLYPALVKNGYPEGYSLGVIMTGGALGLLLPPSVPILIYSLVAGVDFTEAFKACVAPGMMMIAIVAVHAMYTGVKHKIARSTPSLSRMGAALWEVKWELLIPVIVLGSLAVGLADIDEAAALAAVYVLGVELFIFKDLKIKDLPRLAANAIALAGAMLVIMAMAVALTNYLITEQVPAHLFAFITSVGITKLWHFLAVRNILMYIIGAVMEGFSAILVGVPLLIPFGAEFHLSPFHLAVMFLLDLEIAFLSPPFGQNLFVASFRFRKPMTVLYRMALPFLGLMVFGLCIVMFVPRLSTIMVEKDIAVARAKAEKRGEPPREAWLLECVQEDRNNPLPCTEEDQKKYGSGKDIQVAEPAGSGEPGEAAPPAPADLDEDKMAEDFLKGSADDDKGDKDGANPDGAGKEKDQGAEGEKDGADTDLPLEDDKKEKEQDVVPAGSAEAPKPEKPAPTTTTKPHKTLRAKH